MFNPSSMSTPVPTSATWEASPSDIDQILNRIRAKTAPGTTDIVVRGQVATMQHFL